jgi:hypothetical protein
LPTGTALTATIVQLSDYRKPPKAPRTVAPRADPAQGAPHYFCLRCDTDDFKLYSSGVVHCSHCGALMRNITVSDSEEGKAGSK